MRKWRRFITPRRYMAWHLALNTPLTYPEARVVVDTIDADVDVAVRIVRGDIVPLKPRWTFPERLREALQA